MVVRGEAGIGKTELLRYVADRSSGCRVIRAAGVQSEMELSYAGLHQLCAPLLTRLDDLPDPQRDALSTAFGLRSGDVPSRFLVSLAALSLLADTGARQPLVCLVDDAQWLDHASAQTLAFVARRLFSESILLLFAIRETGTDQTLAGLPDLELAGLSETDSRALLDSVVLGRLDERVRDRIVAETRGNPLALLELPRSLTAAELAGGFVRPDARPLSGQIEQGFIDRIEGLPAHTRLLLCAAAGEPTGDVPLLRRAAALLGIAVDVAATPAETSGLVTFGSRVRFRHPLARSAAYRAADADARRRVHRALADATDAQLDPDRRVWHLARAAAEPDETVAAELERSADRARARGGVAAAAAFLDRAAELTPEPARRGARTLAAAQAKYQAGAFDAALQLAAAAELSPLDQRGTAMLTLLRGQILDTTRSSSAALPVLLDAGRRLEAVDAGLAHATYRDAFFAAINTRGLAGSDIVTVAGAVLAAPMPEVPTRRTRLLTGVATMATQGFAAGISLAQQAIDEFRTGEVSTEEVLGWIPLSCRIAADIWDAESWSALSDTLVRMARDSGTLSVLPLGLLLRIPNRAFAGQLDEAQSLTAELVAIGEATGAGFLATYGALFTEPWRGNEDGTRRAMDELNQNVFTRGQAKVQSDTQWAAAVLYNGLGRYGEAQVAAKRACENPDELGLSTKALSEYVEASAHLGQAADAADAVRTLREMAEASGTDWGLGIAAYVRALVTTGDEADGLYREAIERLDGTGMAMDLARSRLAYGEWLRRGGRRLDARAQLGPAYEMLTGFGANAFAERAGRELRATGATVRKRTIASHQALTAQEAQIAQLAGDGLTNPEIGARLFISQNTVDWHLRKVFTKLGIASRREIRAVLPTGAASSA